MTSSNPPNPLPKGTLQQRMAAKANACGGSYEILLAPWKRKLFGDLHGNILEIGPGAGPNLAYFPADAHWLGVEPNPASVQYLQQAIRRLERPAENYRIDPGDAHGKILPVDDASQDAVVCSLVLCSATRPRELMSEIVRVLKPGGRFAFIEHVAAPRGTRLRTLQNLITPLSILFEDGCRPNRETWTTIFDAGFERVEIEHFQIKPGILGVPFIAGWAEKAV